MCLPLGKPHAVIFSPKLQVYHTSVQSWEASPILQTLYWSFKQVPALAVFFYPWNCHVSFLFYSSLKQQHLHWCAALQDCLYSFECTWNLVYLQLWVFSYSPRWERWLHFCSRYPCPAWEGGAVRQWNPEESSRYWSWRNPFPLSREKSKYFASMWVENLHFGYVCTNVIAPEEWYGLHFRSAEEWWVSWRNVRLPERSFVVHDPKESLWNRVYISLYVFAIPLLLHCWLQNLVCVECSQT